MDLGSLAESIDVNDIIRSYNLSKHHSYLEEQGIDIGKLPCDNRVTYKGENCRACQYFKQACDEYKLIEIFKEEIKALQTERQSQE
ncbi:MAG: hypothetical protein KKE20_01685 [Nanoarchaeota archaeon]|nr:hypothetical protein [Nanoarchaeota archaeon]